MLCLLSKAPGFLGIELLSVIGLNSRKLQFVVPVDVGTYGHVDRPALDASKWVVDSTTVFLQSIDAISTWPDVRYGVGKYVRRRYHFRSRLLPDDTLVRNGGWSKLMYCTWKYETIFRSTWHQSFRNTMAFLLKFSKWVTGQWMYTCLLYTSPSPRDS